jgi:putative oxidoreductase
MKTVIKNMTAPTHLPRWWQDAMLLLPRLICGWWLMTDVAEYGGIFKMFPAFFAWMGAFSEAVGGLFLILGFQTRIFSFLILCTMLVAAFIQHAHGELWNKLPALGFAWVAVYCMALGGGRFSIDYLLTKKMKK